MKQRITIVGGAAVGDYIFQVDHLPEKGEMVRINSEPQPLVSGGCAPNIAAGIAALGQLTPVLCYPVGDDPDTSIIRKKWDQQGIVCHLTEVPNEISGRSWTFMQPDGATMSFAYSGAADRAKPDSSSLEPWVIIAPILNAFTSEYLRTAVESNHQVLVTGIASPDLLKYLSRINILVVNMCECQTICNLGGFDDAEEISSAHPDLLLYVTNGAKGSSLFYKGVELKIPVVKADKVVDVTGAGDAYTSGLISALLQGYNPVLSGWIGAANASYVVEQFGGQDITFPSWDMIWKRLK